MFLAGSLGITLGAPLVFALFRPLVGNEFWSGFGTLAGSWTGGSANMIAVKEALGTPNEVFSPMVIVDTIVPYTWMGFMIAMAHFQKRFDEWNRADRRIVDEISQRLNKLNNQIKSQITPVMTIVILAIGFLGCFLAQTLAGYLPVIKDVVTKQAWTIIVVSLLGISLSFSSVHRLQKYGMNKIGYFLLYFVLTAIGARASLVDIGSTFILILAGFTLILFHGGILLACCRIFKVPLFLATTASQACVGGVASAPIVAEIYQPGFASVGLLLAILGNIIGTYLGIVAGQICRLFI